MQKQPGICMQVASHLWQLISEQANLLTYLEALKDYFLLGRGDFLQLPHGGDPKLPQWLEGHA